MGSYQSAERGHSTGNGFKHGARYMVSSNKGRCERDKIGCEREPLLSSDGFRMELKAEQRLCTMLSSHENWCVIIACPQQWNYALWK